MALLVWISSGLFSLIGAYCFAELGCMIKKSGEGKVCSCTVTILTSGADYAYIMVALGRFPAFIRYCVLSSSFGSKPLNFRMWVECIIIMPATIAIVALTFSIYALKPFFPECSPPDEAAKLLAVLCITVLAFVNCWDVKWATTIQAQNLYFSQT